MKIFVRGANNRGITNKAIAGQPIPQSRPTLLQSRAFDLVAEWQQRGPETASGQALRKLRLSFAPTDSAVIAGAVA